jgi:2-oxoglutarate ferredoxin oxidoreductase subunit beta
MSPQTIVAEEKQQLKHPMEDLLRMDRMPHIWCPTCGLGTVLTAWISALEKTGIDPNQTAVISGIGCTGRAAGYLRVDSLHTTHGRP